MWTIAAVNKKFDGPLGSYNGLTDIHLAHYFARPFRRSHLQFANLITSDGVIVPERKVKVENLQYEKKKKLCDILATAVVQNAVHEEGSWNKKLCNYLENISKMNNVENIKKTKKKCAKFGSNASNKKHLSNELFHECSYFKPNPIGGKIIDFCHSAPADFSYIPYPTKVATSTQKRCISATEHSPYITPLFMSKSFKQTIKPIHKKAHLRRRKKHKRHIHAGETMKTTDFDLSKDNFKKFVGFEKQIDMKQCKITLYYHGRSPIIHSSNPVMQDVLIKQQHRGGTPVVVYKGKIVIEDSLTFVSLDHEGFSFSITAFIDGIRDLKLSSCCVFRYPSGKRLGGSSGSFSIQKIEGGTPCLKCQYNAIQTKSMQSKQENELCEFLLTDNNSKPFKITEVTKIDCPIAQPNLLFSNQQGNDEISKTSAESISNAEDDIEEISDITDHDENGDEIKSSKAEKIAEEVDSAEESKSSEVSSYNSSSSNASIKEITPTMKANEDIYINTDSSSEDDGEKQHVIVASVHGSPISH